MRGSRARGQPHRDRHQDQADHLEDAGDLAEHDGPDQGGRGRQDRGEQREGRRGQAPHRERLEGVGNRGGQQAHADDDRDQLPRGQGRHRARPEEGREKQGAPRASERQVRHPVARGRGLLPDDDVGRPGEGREEDPGDTDAHARHAEVEGEPADACHPGEREDGGDAWPPAVAPDDGDGDGADELDGHGGAQGNARNRLVERGVHRQDDDAEQRGNSQVGAREAAAPRAFPGQEDDRAGQHAPPGDGGGSDGREGDDRERSAHVLDEAGPDDVELGRDTVGDGALGGRVHWAGAKVRAAEFMQ